MVIKTKFKFYLKKIKIFRYIYIYKINFVLFIFHVCVPDGCVEISQWARLVLHSLNPRLHPDTFVARGQLNSIQNKIYSCLYNCLNLEFRLFYLELINSLNYNFKF